MIVSLRWINEFVDLPTHDPEELAAVLDQLGLQVEGWERVGVGFSGVIVAGVTEVKPHPHADRLRVATLETGRGAHTVVCGAWNFEAGAVVPLATPGAVLAGGLEVGERRIRGVDSPGMICSEAELGIGEDAAGILVLADDHAPFGSDFGGTLPYPDVVFDLEITPNRPDAMSVYGVARDLAAYYELPLQPIATEVEATGPPTQAKVIVEDAERCPRFTAREIRNIQIGPSPLWMRLRLRDAGVRPISNVVDITNYVTLEVGQPLHAFDLDLIPEETLVIRRARAGERLLTLDSVDRELDTEDLLVAGPDAGLALAGIMGGEDSEVGERTSRVLLEVAHFSAPHTLLSGKRHNLRTEAVARFERGVDPALPPIASARASRLMAELAGGEVAGAFIDVYSEPVAPWEVELPAGEAGRLLGVDLGVDAITGLLRRLGFEASGGDPIRVTVPTFRPDVTRPADLVEEVARLYGYDNIPTTLPHGPGGGLSIAQRRERLARQVMVGAGYSEVMSYSFVGPNDIAGLGLPADDPRADAIPVRNPLNEEEGLLRTTLLPGLLRAVRTNQARHNESGALFEVGRVFRRGGEEIPDQPERLGFVAAGRRQAAAWTGARAGFDVWDAVGLWETLADGLGIASSLDQGSDPVFHPGRCARVAVADTTIGFVGEVHPSVAGRFDIAGRVVAGELDLGPLVAAPPALEFAVPIVFPPVVFDLAFDLPAEVAAGDLIEVVRHAGRPALERVELFDVFAGPPLEEGRRSLALRLTVRDPQRTLTDEEVAPLREAIAAAVAERLEGRLRGGG